MAADSGAATQAAVAAATVAQSTSGLGWSDIVALVGAAAWLPQIWRFLQKPKVTPIVGGQVEIGFTHLGPVFNPKVAFRAQRRDALVTGIQYRLQHERGQTPIVYRPGQRQSISAASAVGPRGEFWFCTYVGGLNGELFVELLSQLMHRRKKPVRLILDSLPAHKTRLVRDYVESTEGKLSLHFLPGYAPELNPDELVWSHVKRTGTARRPLQQGEKLAGRIDQQLADVRDDPKLVRSFFDAPSVAYIRDC